MNELKLHTAEKEYWPSKMMTEADSPDAEELRAMQRKTSEARRLAKPSVRPERNECPRKALEIKPCQTTPSWDVHAIDPAALPAAAPVAVHGPVAVVVAAAVAVAVADWSSSGYLDWCESADA